MAVPDQTLAVEALLILLRRQRVCAAISGLCDAFSVDGVWERASVPPHNLEQQPSEMEKLWTRFQAGAVTLADRELLAKVPTCHVPAEELVEALATLCESV